MRTIAEHDFIAPTIIHVFFTDSQGLRIQDQSGLNLLVEQGHNKHPKTSCQAAKVIQLLNNEHRDKIYNNI